MNQVTAARLRVVNYEDRVLKQLSLMRQWNPVVGALGCTLLVFATGCRQKPAVPAPPPHPEARRPPAPTIHEVAIITTVAGNGALGFAGDGGPASAASLDLRGLGNSLARVAVDSSGNLFFVDATNQRIRKVEAATGIITTVAGDGFRDANGYGRFAGDGGPATLASFFDPCGVAVDASGNIFVADKNNRRVRRVDKSGIITTIAGNGRSLSPGDGKTATLASVMPGDVAVDPAGNVIIFDLAFKRIRKVDSTTGVISTVAGDGSEGSWGDGGLAVEASLELGKGGGIAVDSHGNIFVSEFKACRVHRVDAATGIITTVAGDGFTDANGIGAFSGDGGPATVASLSNPNSVAVDRAGNLYIADTNNDRIRKIDAVTGVISTVAGGAAQGFAGDGGPAAAAKLCLPSGVSVDSSGNVFIADRCNNRIRRILTAR